MFKFDFPVLDTIFFFHIPDPLENTSLTLFEVAFNGQENDLRDLLIHRLAYVDVWDSHGLAALHFATYIVYINVIDILLNSY
ncbi:unnamed protein product [Rotaria sp. Silwood2]|nr:unnamed protein product [Rotaria sp. Silwood2]CAF3510650.1 unnamed protein product [Rotaria sp. Silwood2]CAF4205222.1 unnamed protein product [Rotaria sp. Silwood2]CAF4745131.1 unnamed protein product [Rotaria sp. Silwood2]